MSLTPQHLDRTEQLFFQALELPEAERGDFLQQQCEGEPELQAEIQRLLKSEVQEDTSSFILDHAPVVPVADVEHARVGEHVGDVIGPYRLLEKIGEGGMGVVYMAEQQTGLQRKVALKIVKLGMDTRQVMARFEAERQAMALFEHPGIARVLDSGATESGRPYFVMELVKGTDIVAFTKNRRLELAAKLSLFAEVCQAVQHAHQKGIIHRDLKPSNILVTLIDGKPVPKIIDFGVVKAVGHRLTEKTLFTRYAAMIGTPQYMSPEQAELSGSDVDTRSDIYSLGVVLYELLTGTTPLDRSALSDLNPLALFETIRDAEFLTPSARMTRLESRSGIHRRSKSGDVAGNFESDDRAPGSLDPTPKANPTRTLSNANQTLPKLERPRHELDWIVMKALSAERSLRYETASEFAADLKRYLAGDPVLAAPPSHSYQIRAYLRKHRTSLATFFTIASLLVVGSIASLGFALRSNQLNQELSDALHSARTNLSRAEAAESELRDAKLEQDYEAAHTIAFSKFSVIEFREMSNFIEEHELFEPDFALNESSTDETVPLEESDDNFYCDLVCFVYDREKLFEFSKLSQFKLPTERLLEFSRGDQAMEAELNGFFNSLEAPEDSFDMTDEHEHTPECLKFQEAWKGQLLTVRPMFFRLLVEEYRRVFGETDSKVSEALTLLAASLIEIGDFQEAEAHLREAMLLADEKDASLNRQLMKLVQRDRK